MGFQSSLIFDRFWFTDALPEAQCISSVRVGVIKCRLAMPLNALNLFRNTTPRAIERLIRGCQGTGCGSDHGYPGMDIIVMRMSLTSSAILINPLLPAKFVVVAVLSSFRS